MPAPGDCGRPAPPGLLRRSSCGPDLRVAKPLAIIALAANRLPPPFVGEIPVDRPRQARLETFLRRPSEFALDFGRVDRVAPVVPRPVRDIGYQIAIRFASRTRALGVENVTD